MITMTTDELLKITTRDRLVFAWQKSTELTRDFELYSQEIKDDREASRALADFAEAEAVHAAKLLELLKKYR